MNRLDGSEEYPVMPLESHTRARMAFPTIKLICLEQGDLTLEDNTRDFLDLACLTNFPDRLICFYYHHGLSERCKARLPVNGPRE
ncbi:hypothetical protein E1301_Tti016792 [Triplophysa tibetana]|uniref:Uncharacterized protein n=1 Tax=Triplophysa tibetana TaxID=1572043 RepID=A0A5A9PEN7_9TELE|nr:hypothetical protein E1301_Tti016792 [Triplophysa tibetana]